MTEGPPWKGIMSFMMPVLLGLLLQQLYNTVDTIIVGNFAGEDSVLSLPGGISFWGIGRRQQVVSRVLLDKCRFRYYNYCCRKRH